MRQIASFALVLLILAFVSLRLNAQSGRNRAAQSTNTQGETIEGDVIHVNTSLVMVPVTVMDRYGKYIPNLRQQDFHISDEGVEQRIAYFATVNQLFMVALVIDTSGSTHFRL